MAIAVCRVCLRPLKDASSVEEAIGPRCAKRRKAWLNHLRDAGHAGAELGEIRPGEDVVLSLNRQTGNMDSNIPRRYTYKDCDKQGYGFDSPRDVDLSINILACFGLHGYVPFALAVKFAGHFLSNPPVEGLVIKRRAIEAWIAERSALVADHNPNKEH